LTDRDPPRLWTLVAAICALAVGTVALGPSVLTGYFLLSSRSILAGGLLPAQDQLIQFYDTLPGFLFAATISGGWTGVVALVAGMLSPVPLRERLGFLPSRLGAAGWWIVPLGALGLNQAVDAAFHLTGFGRGDALEALLKTLAGARGPTIALAVFVVGALSATCEELFFRGYLQRRLVLRFGPLVGVAVPALLFGLAHLDLHHALFALTFGLYVGAAAWAADSTGPAIAAHVVNNTVSVLTLVLGLDFGTDSTGGQWASLLIGGAVAAWALAWILRRAPRPRVLERAAI
jgi:membrane protease YdiL (CAAX protease family)